MEPMSLVEEWSKSFLSENTRLHHERGLRYYTEYMEENIETLLKLRKEQNSQNNIFSSNQKD